MKLSLSHERWIAFRGLAILVEYREISPRDRESLRAASADATALVDARASGDLDKLPEDLDGAETSVEDIGTRMVAGCVNALRASKLEEIEGVSKPTGKRRPLSLDYYNGDGSIHEGTWNDLDANQRVCVLRSYPKLMESLTGMLLHAESAILLGK